MEIETTVSETSLKQKVVTAIWAIDPAEQALRPNDETIQQVRELVGGSFVRVRPVVINSGDPGEEKQIQEKVYDLLRPLKSDLMPEAEVISTNSYRWEDWAADLIKVAQRDQAKLIIMTSHGRSGLKTFIMGSLARELLQVSPIPLLLLNPHPQRVPNREKVLFATDLSEESHGAYRKFVDLVRGKAKEVILFHAMMNSVVSTSRVSSLPESIMAEQRDFAEAEIELWKKEAEAAGLKVQVIFSAGISLTGVVRPIREIAERENVGLIGLVSHAEALERLILGSVTANFLSSQEWNLWVCGPSFDQGNSDPF